MITSPAFTGARVLGAVLCEDALRRTIDGRPAVDYLWQVKGVLPFLRIDVGVSAEHALAADLIAHPRVARVLADSGGHGREDATARLTRNAGLIAGFGRALLDGLTVRQSDEEFDRALDTSIESLYRASTA
ncbi:MAG: hypothetical protein QM604_01770 [Microbacterium sp.]